MFTREHLIIGAAGFVLGGIVATASITVVLSTQKPEPVSASAPVTVPAPAVAAPATTPPAPSAPIAPVAAPTPEAPAPVAAAPVTRTPPPVAAAPKPAKPAPVKPATAPAAPLAAEETDRQAEEAKQLAARKKALDSQVSDSEEIIRLKAQQIRDMEERLKTGH